jgi:hypothetical protein
MLAPRREKMGLVTLTDAELDVLADGAKRAARVEPAVRTYLGHFSPEVAAFFVNAPVTVAALVREIQRLRADRGPKY